MKVLLVGASGTLGRAIHKELATRHEIVTAGRTSGDVKLDITDCGSIEKALAQVGQIDAVVSAVGEVTFLPLSEIQAQSLETSPYALGLKNKLMGQVNLALAAQTQLRNGGSITLTSGILSEQPIRAGTSASMVNGALESFVRAAAIELPRGLRINVVSPNVFQESMDGYAPFFRGFEAIPVSRAALAFSRSVEGLQTGQVYKVF
ncbi:short chain dehydrogenase [bacterium]|nr:short chain dehydrogenase [bacterium]